MKKELLSKFIEKALTYIETAETFASKELPIYVREVLTYELTIAYVGFTVSVFFILLSVLLIYIGYRTYKLKTGHEADMVMPMFIGALILIPALIIVSIHLGTIIKIKTAPRVFLIDYIRDKS